MKCKNAESYIVEYLYQELSPGKTVDLEKHLSGCRRCSETLESWRAVHRSYQKIADHPQPSPFLKQRVLAAAGEELRKGTPWIDRVWLIARLAAVPVLIFGIAMLFYLPQKEEGMISQVQAPAKPSSVVETPRASEVKRQRMELEPDADLTPHRLEEKAVDALGSRKDAAGDDRTETETRYPAAGFKEGLLSKEEQESSRDETYGTGRSYNVPAAPAPEPMPAEQAAEEFADYGESVQSSAARLEAPKQKAASKSTVAPPEVLYEQSQVMFRRNELRSGVSIAREAIKQDQDKSLAGQFHQSGVDFQNKGEYENAIAQYNLVVSHYPKYAALDDVLMRLGDLYAQAGQLQEAESAYQRLSARQGQLKGQKLLDLKKKQEAQDQLKALGYVKD